MPTFTTEINGQACTCEEQWEDTAIMGTHGLPKTWQINNKYIAVQLGGQEGTQSPCDQQFTEAFHGIFSRDMGMQVILQFDGG